MRKYDRNMTSGLGDGSGYEDIIHLPHHVSEGRPRMSPKERAAQFSPFAALTGYEEAIREAARQNEERTVDIPRPF